MWGIIFVLGAILTNAWPAWATGSATLLTFAFGLGDGIVPVLSAVFLVILGVMLTFSPVVYRTVEKAMIVMISIVLIFMVVATFTATDASSWASVVTQAPSGIANLPQFAEEIGAATLLGAVALAGAGGASNLVQSNWIRDKGMGMGAHIPRIVSPITGEEEARPSLGYVFPQTEENLRRWRGWWRVANQEQLITFLFLGLLTFIFLSVLVNSTIGVGDFGEGFAFIQAEGEALKEIVAPWFGTLFWLAGSVILFKTNLGILDWVSRLTADSLKITFLAESRFWSESKIYFAMVWIEILASCAILLAGLNQPLALLVIAAAGGGVLMTFYSVLLIMLNRRALPGPIKLRGFRLVVMILTAAMFIGLSIYLVIDQAMNLAA